MASEDIIQHIIRDIVAKSSVILRQETTNATQLVLDSDTIAKDVFVGGILSYNQNTIVTDTLAAFVIRSVVLDPNNGFGSEQEMSTQEVDRLIDVIQ